jgi:hypothetical protein
MSPAKLWIADAAFGIVLGSGVNEGQIPVIEKSADDVGGSVRFFSRGAETISVDFSTNPVERHIIERLKLAFDPDGKLNPVPRFLR